MNVKYLGLDCGACGSGGHDAYCVRPFLVWREEAVCCSQGWQARAGAAACCGGSGVAPGVGACFGRENGGAGAGGGGKPCPEAGMRSRLLLPGLLIPVQQSKVAFQITHEWLTRIGCFLQTR